MANQHNVLPVKIRRLRGRCLSADDTLHDALLLMLFVRSYGVQAPDRSTWTRPQPLWLRPVDSVKRSFFANGRTNASVNALN